MLKVLFGLYLLMIVISTQVLAAQTPPKYIQSLVPKAQVAGDGRLTFFLMDVYDAALFAPQGQFKDDEPFALQLVYLRDLKGQSIARTSAQEIRRLGFTDHQTLIRWEGEMTKIFPDVSNGVSLTGVYTKDRTTVFFKDGKKIGTISDPAFGKWFFSIWLNEKTRAPELRRELLGMKGQSFGTAN